MPGPILRIEMDPSILRSFGDVNKANDVALANIRALEREAAKLESDGKQLSARQVQRLREFEEIVDEAKQLETKQKELAKFEKSQRQTLRDLKTLNAAISGGALREFAEGRYFSGAAALLQSKTTEKLVTRVMERLGASEGLQGKVGGALSNAHIYAQLISGIYDSAEKLVGRSAGGEGIVFDPRAHSANYEARKRLAMRQWGYRQQREYTDLQDRSFSWIQNPFGDSDAEKALKTVDAQGTLAEGMSRSMGQGPANFDLSRRTSTYQQINQDMFRAQRENRARSDDAIRLAMRKTFRFQLDDSSADFAAKTFQREFREAMARTLNTRRRDFGELTDEDYKRASADSFLVARDKTLEMLATPGEDNTRMKQVYGDRFNEYYKDAMDHAGMMPEVAKRLNRTEQAKVDADVRKMRYVRNWPIEQNQARYHRDHLPMKWDD